MILCISVVSVVTSLSFLIFFLNSFFFFPLVSLSKGCQFFLFKKLALSFTNLLYYLFSLYFIYFHSVLYCFLLSINFGLCLFFFLMLNVKKDCLFEVFLIS